MNLVVLEMIYFTLTSLRRRGRRLRLGPTRTYLGFVSNVASAVELPKSFIAIKKNGDHVEQDKNL